MNLSKSLCASIMLLLTWMLCSCQRSGSGDLIQRLESAKKIEAEFQLAVKSLYTAEETLPVLAAMLSGDGYAFTLTASNRKDVDRIAPTFAQILKRQGVKSASLVLIGNEIIVEGRTVTTEKRDHILGGFRVHDDGTVEKTPIHGLMSGSIDATSSPEKAE